MSKIEWTHRPGTKSEVLNPTTGCDKISRGCKFCYAETMHRRLRAMGQPKYQKPFLGHVEFWPDELEKPFHWREPRMVFLNSMSDIFHKKIEVWQIAEIYAMMWLNHRHTFVVLTKRADRARSVLISKEFFHHFWAACNRLHDKYVHHLSEALYFEDELAEYWPLENVWQGVSVENQDEDHRIEDLSATPAHIRVVSYEPAVGPLDLSKFFGLYQLEDGTWHTKVGSRWEGSPDWVIAGGESGPKAVPSHPDWFRTVRDQCKAVGVAFFFKQNGEWQPGTTTDKKNIVVLRDGRVVDYDVACGQGFTPHEWAVQNPTVMSKVGKHCSGNFLDGVQHLEFPA